MSWLKVDDGFHSHPKVMRAGTAAAGLWVRCGSYVAQHLTDGFVPREVARAYGSRAQITALVEAGLWTEVEGGWCFHDWDEHNPTAIEVRADRAAKHEAKVRAGRSGGLASGVARRKHGGSTAEANGEAQPKQNEAPSRPVPSLTPQTPSVGRRKRRATPPPDTFELDDDLRAWGREHAPHVTDPAAETRQFLDHARANAKTFVDWRAAWRTWMGNAEKYALERRGNVRPMRGNARVAEGDAILREAYERGRAQHPELGA